MKFPRLIKRNQGDNEKLVFQPAVDIIETDSSVILEIDMPGVQKDSLNVELIGDQLIVGAIRKTDALDDRYAVVYQERYHNLEYRRVFQLNAEVDKENISADYQNGVLKIILAKVRQAQPQKIEISA